MGGRTDGMKLVDEICQSVENVLRLNYDGLKVLSGCRHDNESQHSGINCKTLSAQLRPSRGQSVSQSAALDFSTFACQQYFFLLVYLNLDF